jgi:hypothetical protein
MKSAYQSKPHPEEQAPPPAPSADAPHIVSAQNGSLMLALAKLETWIAFRHMQQCFKGGRLSRRVCERAGVKYGGVNEVRCVDIDDAIACYALGHNSSASPTV